jgi:hypothetical protein
MSYRKVTALKKDSGLPRAAKKRKEHKAVFTDEDKQGLKYHVGLPEDTRVHNNGEANPHDG